MELVAAHMVIGITVVQEELTVLGNALFVVRAYLNQCSNVHDARTCTVTAIITSPAA
jgi:hypothetical protein